MPLVQVLNGLDLGLVQLLQAINSREVDLLLLFLFLGRSKLDNNQSIRNQNKRTVKQPTVLSTGSSPARTEIPKQTETDRDRQRQTEPEAETEAEPEAETERGGRDRHTQGRLLIANAPNPWLAVFASVGVDDL